MGKYIVANYNAKEKASAKEAEASNNKTINIIRSYIPQLFLRYLFYKNHYYLIY